MHGQIDSCRSQRLFDLFGEHSLGADLGEGNVGDLVSGGFDNFDFHFMATLAQ